MANSCIYDYWLIIIYCCCHLVDVDQEVRREQWLNPLAWKNVDYYGSKWSEAVDESSFIFAKDW